MSFPLAASARTIRLATVDWPPYYGSMEPNQGPITQVARAAFAAAGHQLVVDFMPWSRALTVVKAGDYDGILGGYQDRERDQYIHFTTVPLAETEVVLFARKDKIVRFKTMRDLVGMRIGQLRGAVHTDAFDQANYLNKVMLNSTVQGVEMLVAGRLDIVIDSPLVLLTNLRTRWPEAIQKISVLEPPLATRPFFVGFSRRIADHDALVREYDAGMRKIIANGTYSDLTKPLRIEMPR